jgi:hypothetical protein
MTLCVPEVQPEVRFEKPKCPTRARKKCYEMLKFHCDEIIGEGYRAIQEKKKERKKRRNITRTIDFCKKLQKNNKPPHYDKVQSRERVGQRKIRAKKAMCLASGRHTTVILLQRLKKVKNKEG